MAAGAVVLTATPVAIAGTTSAPAQAVNNTDAAKQHNAARQNGLRGPDWDLGDDHCNDVNLRSKANNRFVSAEVDYTGSVSGMLRARTANVGDWEEYALCPGNGFHTLYSYSAKRYVSAELGYAGADYGMLPARSNSSDGPWEKFLIS